MTSSYAQDMDSISNDKLKMCTSNYSDGYYDHAVQCIDQTLPSLTNFKDSVDAFKLLALSYGMLNQIDKAKEYFGIALDKDSAMNIDTLAFPPNITLIYNQVKLEKKMSRIETSKPPKPVVGPKRKKTVAAPVLLSSVILFTGGAAGLYVNSYLTHRDYLNARDQATMDKKWKEYTYSIAGGIGCTVVSGVTSWLFFRLINRNSAVSVSGDENSVVLTYKF